MGQAGQPWPLRSAGCLGPADPALGCDARLAALLGACPPGPSGALGHLCHHRGMMTPPSPAGEGSRGRNNQQTQVPQISLSPQRG